MKRRFGVFVVVLLVMSGVAMISAGALLAPARSWCSRSRRVMHVGAAVNLCGPTPRRVRNTTGVAPPTDANWSVGVGLR
jgi:hypothetical protein